MTVLVSCVDYYSLVGYSNGILTEHFMLEVNGQNVVGMKDKEIKQILEASPRTLTITVMPKFVYKHMMDQ